MNDRRWWEHYILRYLVGTIVGVGMLEYLRRHSAMRHSLPQLEWAEQAGQFLAQLSLLAAIGFAFCYVASAPILTLHATREHLRPSRWKRTQGLLLGVLTVFLGTVSLNILPVGPAIVLTCVLGAQYFLLGSAALNRLKDVKSFYVALSSARASSEGDDRGRQVREYVESYRHLREHGNAFLVLLLEVALAYVLLSVCDAAQAVWIIILWICPGACSWFIATTLEIRFVHRP